MAKTGIRYALWKTFGWYEASPVNLSKQEVERWQFTDISQLSQINDFEERFTLGSKDPQAHIKEMEEMSQHDLVHPVVSLYAEEATQPDISEGKSVWYECNDTDIQDNLNDMLERVRIEDYIYSIAFNTCGTGNDFRRILRNSEGIQQIVGTKIHSVKRLWDPTTRRLLGFKWEGGTPKEEDIVFTADENVWPPWDFIHFRRIADTDTEYGRSLIDHLFPLYRKIKMATDQMVMYRLHTMPNRHMVFVDVGNQSVMEAMETINQFKQLMRHNTMLNIDQGTYQSRYDVPALDSILWVPVRSDETNTKVSKMEGDRDVPDVHDLEYLTKSFYGGARVPKAYVGHGDDSGGLAQASLVSQDIRFARMVRVLRRPLIAGFHRLAQLHLIFQGIDPDQYKITVRMSKISSIEEEVNAAAMETQVNLSRSLVDICQALEIPNREIIELVFREYLHLPRKFIDVAKLAVSIQQAMGGGEEDDMGMGMGPGMGGDLGGLGDDLGLDDEPLGGEGLGGDEPPPLDLEATRIKKYHKLLLDGIRSRSKNLLTESRGAGGEDAEKRLAALNEARQQLGSVLTEITRQRTSKKVSLVEADENRCSRLKRTPDMPSVGDSEMDISEAVSAFQKAHKDGLITETLAGEASEANAHPSVQAVRRARGKPSKGS